MKRLACLAALWLALAACAQDARHPLNRAMDYDNNLLLVLDLQPDNQQLLQLLSLSRAGAQQLSQAQAQDKQAAQSIATVLQQQVQALKQNTPVPPDVVTAIDAYYTATDERRERLLAGVDDLIQQLRRSLVPEQARLVDWSAPAGAAPADSQAATEKMRHALAVMNEIRDALETIRYLTPMQYSTTRVGRIDYFLSAYIRPNTPQFARAHDWMIGLTDEMRQVPEQQWPQEAPLFAGRVMQELGVLNGLQAPQNGPPYGWWDVYNLLTDPQTPEMIQQLIANRGNPAGG